MSVVLCRACCCADVVYLWHDRDGYRWYRCAACGSDTSEATYDPTQYGRVYVGQLLADEGEGLSVSNHIHNIEAFDRRYQPHIPRTMLDVGCGHGGSMIAATMRGWSVTGWDITTDGRPDGVIVSPEFRADLLSNRFGAVLAREVIEHVPDPYRLLAELAKAVVHGGRVQITTPRPLDEPHPHVYRWSHLCVWSVLMLAEAVESSGLHIMEHHTWSHGQRLLATVCQ